MARVKGAMMTRKRRNKVLKLAKGYWGAKCKHFKMAKQAVMKSGNYAAELMLTNSKASGTVPADIYALVKLNAQE